MYGLKQKHFWFSSILLFSISLTFAQKKAVLNIQRELDSLRHHKPLEKIYVQTDKMHYLLGDTVWYKTYILDAAFGTPSPISGIVYIELMDGQGQLVQRSRQVLFAGSCYGDFFLDPTKFQSGQFTLRAYTRWLQNFGEAYFFHKTLTVSGNFIQEWAVNLTPLSLADTTGQAPFITMQMALHNLNGKPFRMQPIEFEMRDKGKSLFRERFIVDSSGVLQPRFRLSKRKDLAQTEVWLWSDGAVKARFPLTEWSPNIRYDVQFLPESGHWLANAPNVIGVKILDGQGQGVNAKGLIFNKKNVQVGSFSCTHKGMGKIMLPALPADDYYATVQFPDGKQQDYPMPKPSNGAVIMHYDGSHPQKDIQLMIRSTGFSAENQSLMLIGQSHGLMYYGALLHLTADSLLATIPRGYFPEGIVHFSLLTLDGLPMAERMVYNHTKRDPLRITISPHQGSYYTRDSVALHITIRDSLGHPAMGNFSLAVTDDQQYPVDSLGFDFWNSYYLSSELQGEIEEPGYYFSEMIEADAALDNLLLTQGWIRYDQSWLTEKRKFTYQPEPFFAIEGTVKNMFGKALKGVDVLLLSSGKTSFLIDTLTDERGQFQFRDFPPFDTIGFVIQARNRHGKSANVGIDLALDTRPPLWKAKKNTEKTWFVNLDTTLQRRLMDQREYERNLRALRYHVDPNMIQLEEVSITAKKAVKNSKNLNGPGEADQILDEDALVEAGSKSLLDILEEKIDGFHLGLYPRKNGKPAYMVNEKKARLIFDGVDLEFFYDPEMGTHQLNDHQLFLKSYLENYSGNDVLGIEIMYNPRYNSRYNAHYLSPEELMNVSPVMGTDPVYIEITTRSGNGPFMRKTPGVAHIRPMPLVWPHEFYRPHYQPGTKPTIPGRDLRSTIHWEPMVITDEKGEAAISFYTSDHTGNYTILLEGTDQKGGIGTAQYKIKVE